MRQIVSLSLRDSAALPRKTNLANAVWEYMVTALTGLASSILARLTADSHQNLSPFHFPGTNAEMITLSVKQKPYHFDLCRPIFHNFKEDLCHITN